MSTASHPEQSEGSPNETSVRDLCADVNPRDPLRLRSGQALTAFGMTITPQMFIELTDHLRCPADHDESFLVLLPDRMEGRSVRTGHLGCPVCGRAFQLVDGVLDTADAPVTGAVTSSALDAGALTALVGLHGPGGYLTLVGPVGALWNEVAELNPGVALVAVNPPPAVVDSARLSVLRGGRLPIKSGAMRGVVLGRPYADDPYWIGEAARVVLPGLRVVGEGGNPESDLIDLLASADGVWVGRGKR